MLGRIFLDRYETVQLLGEGGMGCVYLARSTENSEKVVVKVMHSHIATNPLFRERFARETRLMKRLKHPNTVAFIDAALDDPGGPCIIMEYLHGFTLDKLLARHGAFSPMRLRRLFGQLCEVLQAAHEIGIIHRDLKPANLMVLEPDTPFEKLKVMDFGLAEMVESDSYGRGRPEYAIGTPGYMPPEQVAGEKTDLRADLYSAGVILYQLLSGRMPFTGGSAMEILMTQAEEGPPTFASLGLGDRVPAPVEAVVRACLAPNPDQRPTSARELGEAYEGALILAYREAEAAAAPPPSPVVPEKTADAEVFHLEAWLPEQIARHKLRGFVDAVGAQITGSEPGVIHVRLRPSSQAMPGSGLLRLFGLCRWSAPIDMELQMQNKDPGRPNLLHITVLMRPTGRGPLPTQPTWKDRCARIQTTLRGYLMS